MTREGFLSDIGRKAPSLIERVVAWLQDMMSKFREYFNNPKGKLTTAQATRMAHEFGRMAKNIVNQDGAKIFRCNAKTHALELATGEKLSSDDKTRRTAKSVQGQFGGRREGERLIFEDEQDADAYAQHAANMERGDFKYSMALPEIKKAATKGVNPKAGNIPQTQFAGKGELEKYFRNATRLTDGELTSQERKWVEFGKDLGVQVVWPDGHTYLKGALKDGVIYLNRRANDRNI